MMIRGRNGGGRIQRQGQLLLVAPAPRHALRARHQTELPQQLAPPPAERNPGVRIRLAPDIALRLELDGMPVTALVRVQRLRLRDHARPGWQAPLSQLESRHRDPARRSDYRACTMYLENRRGP